MDGVLLEPPNLGQVGSAEASTPGKQDFHHCFAEPLTVKSETLKAEFTAIVESAEEGGYWAFCPEVPGANGQGVTIEETKRDLASAIKLILEDRLADGLRGLPEGAIRDTVAVA